MYRKDKDYKKYDRPAKEQPEARTEEESGSSVICGRNAVLELLKEHNQFDSFRCVLYLLVFIQLISYSFTLFPPGTVYHAHSFIEVEGNVLYHS